MRPICRAARLLRAFTALVTVWCLGCSGFEPLLAAFGQAGANGVMTCGSAVQRPDPGAPATVAPIVTAGGQSSVQAASGQDDMGGFTCSCQSCTAESLARGTVAPSVQHAPSSPLFEPAIFVSFARQPAVPPPERAV